MTLNGSLPGHYRSSLKLIIKKPVSLFLPGMIRTKLVYWFQATLKQAAGIQFWLKLSKYVTILSIPTLNSTKI